MTCRFFDHENCTNFVLHYAFILFYLKHLAISKYNFGRGQYKVLARYGTTIF